MFVCGCAAGEEGVVKNDRSIEFYNSFLIH